jgi:hypothetical protein
MHFDEYFDTMAGTGCGITDALGRMHRSQFDCSTRWVQNYVTNYSGAVFDLSLDLDPFTMRASDLYSVGSLSMKGFWSPSDISKKIARFNSDKSVSLTCVSPVCVLHFHCVLNRIPVTANVYSAIPGSQLRTDLDLLWKLIGGLVGVTTNAPASRTKPLARKRPALIPILDKKGSIADRKAKGNRNGNYWDSIISEMTTHQLPIEQGVANMHQCGIPSTISSLRIIDILVWMFRSNQNGRCQ